MIIIQRSKTADSRSCNHAEVSKETLMASTVQHIRDVQAAMRLFSAMIEGAGSRHDTHKLETIDQFHDAFTGGFEDETWWNEHKKERHHLPDIEDLNLIDLLEHVADCVMAGKARSGQVYLTNIAPTVLAKAVKNTFKLLIDEVDVAEETP